MAKQAYDPHLDFPVEYRNPSVGIWIDSGSVALYYFSQNQKRKFSYPIESGFFFPLYINSWSGYISQRLRNRENLSSPRAESELTIYQFI